MWLPGLTESSLPSWGVRLLPHSTDGETEPHGVKGPAQARLQQVVGLFELGDLNMEVHVWVSVSLLLHFKGRSAG